MHRVILNHIESEDNFGTGIWFDQDGRAISILNSNLSNNYFRGLFLEAGPGSFYVDSCSFVDNSKDLPADVEIIEFEYQLGEEIRTGLNLNSVGSSSFSHCEFDQTGTGSDVTPIRIARSYGRTVMAPLIPPPERPYVLSTFLSIFNDCIFRRPSMGGSEPIWIGYPNDDQFCHFMNRTNC